MEKIRNLTACSLVINIVICILISANIVSCIKDAEETEPIIPIPSDTVSLDSSLIVADSCFIASASFLEGEWMAEYVGYDIMQGVNSAIRRVMRFYADGSYDSHVQGINGYDPENMVDFKEFEHEHGLYIFNEEQQLMSYYVEYDSLLNFQTDLLEFHNGKVMPGGRTVTEYNEFIVFSFEKEGRRDWIRVDENLMSIDNYSVRLVYIMKNQ